MCDVIWFAAGGYWYLGFWWFWWVFGVWLGEAKRYGVLLCIFIGWLKWREMDGVIGWFAYCWIVSACVENMYNILKLRRRIFIITSYMKNIWYSWICIEYHPHSSTKSVDVYITLILKTTQYTRKPASIQPHQQISYYCFFCYNPLLSQHPTSSYLPTPRPVKPLPSTPYAETISPNEDPLPHATLTMHGVLYSALSRSWRNKRTP